MSLITKPYEVFYDRNGQPLEDGRIFIGEAGVDPRTTPIQVYWDPAFAVPASQPITTSEGRPVYQGSPGNLYTQAAEYSIRTQDKQGRLIVQNLNVQATVTVGSVGSFISIAWDDIANTTIPATVEQIHAYDRNAYLNRATGETLDAAWEGYVWTTSNAGTEQWKLAPVNGEITSEHCGMVADLVRTPFVRDEFQRIQSGGAYVSGTDNGDAWEAGVNYAAENGWIFRYIGQHYTGRQITLKFLDSFVWRGGGGLDGVFADDNCTAPDGSTPNWSTTVQRGLCVWATGYGYDPAEMISIDCRGVMMHTDKQTATTTGAPTCIWAPLMMQNSTFTDNWFAIYNSGTPVAGVSGSVFWFLGSYRTIRTSDNLLENAVKSPSGDGGGVLWFSAIDNYLGDFDAGDVECVGDICRYQTSDDGISVFARQGFVDRLIIKPRLYDADNNNNWSVNFSPAIDFLPAVRANTTAYAEGDKLRPATANGYYYKVVTAGTSAGAEPADYETAARGATFTDGTMEVQKLLCGIDNVVFEPELWIDRSSRVYGLRIGREFGIGGSGDDREDSTIVSNIRCRIGEFQLPEATRNSGFGLINAFDRTPYRVKNTDVHVDSFTGTETAAAYLISGVDHASFDSCELSTRDGIKSVRVSRPGRFVDRGSTTSIVSSNYLVSGDVNAIMPANAGLAPNSRGSLFDNGHGENFIYPSNRFNQAGTNWSGSGTITIGSNEEGPFGANEGWTFENTSGSVQNISYSLAGGAPRNGSAMFASVYAKGIDGELSNITVILNVGGVKREVTSHNLDSSNWQLIVVPWIGTITAGDTVTLVIQIGDANKFRIAHTALQMDYLKPRLTKVVGDGDTVTKAFGILGSFNQPPPQGTYDNSALFLTHGPDADIYWAYCYDTGLSKFLGIEKKNPTATTAELTAKSSDINSFSKYPGKMVFNTTTGQPLWANGPNQGSVWCDATGTTIITPV